MINLKNILFIISYKIVSNFINNLQYIYKKEQIVNKLLICKKLEVDIILEAIYVPGKYPVNSVPKMIIM